jgi:hypothetical protein
MLDDADRSVVEHGDQVDVDHGCLFTRSSAHARVGIDQRTLDVGQTQGASPGQRPQRRGSHRRFGVFKQFARRRLVALVAGESRAPSPSGGFGQASLFHRCASVP